MIPGSKLGSSSILSVSHRFLSSWSVRRQNHLKEVVKPEKIPLNYWKEIIWVAMDLKESISGKGKCNLKLLDCNHITLLFTKPQGRFQLGFTIACELLGAKYTLYHDPNFENQLDPADSGRALSRITDMCVTHGVHLDTVVRLATDATIPIFSASNNVYCLHKALADFMTFQNNYKRLKGLTLAWVGPPTSIFNTYILFCPKFGINIRYICICRYGSGKMSPVHKFQEKKPIDNEDIIKEFKTIKEAVTGAHIISTEMHPDPKNRIDLELLKSADEDWVFMHTLPRTQEVDDNVFLHKKNLSWESFENYLYIAMLVEQGRTRFVVVKAHGKSG